MTSWVGGLGDVVGTLDDLLARTFQLDVRADWSPGRVFLHLTAVGRH